MDAPTIRPVRDRPVFVDLLVIAALLAGLMYGGLQLLGRTHVAWEARYGDQVETATPSEIREGAAVLASSSSAAPSRQSTSTQQAPRRGWTAADDAELERLRAEAAARLRAYEARTRNTRCIDGTLFKVEGSTYTNIGRC